MRVLITGGSGFIGTHLVGALLAEGHEVRILDKVLSRHYPQLCQVADLRNREAVDLAVRDIDLVYHLAAEHRDDVTPPSLYYEVNVNGSEILAAACSAHGVSRVVFTSSVAVYGLNAGTPTELSPLRPFNHYGRSKAEAEAVLRRWAEEGRDNCLTIVRPTVIFGEGNRGNVYNLVRQIVSRRFVMVGKGRNRKSMGYVKNVVSFLAYVGANGASPLSVYNYADKPDLSMNELVAAVRGFAGSNAGAQVRIPYWLGLAGGACFDVVSLLSRRKLPVSYVRVKKFCATTSVSIDKVRESGFTPPYTLEKGMQNFLSSEFAEATR